MESAPAIVLLKENGVKPIVYHGMILPHFHVMFYFLLKRVLNRFLFNF